MFRVRVQLVLLIVLCLGVVSMSSVLAQPSSITAAQAGAPQIYVPVALQNANASTLTPALYIRSVRAYDWVDEQGRRMVYVVGEIANESTITFGNIVTNIGLADEAGQNGVGGVGYPVLRQTFPGQLNPFAKLFQNVDPAFTVFEISLARYITSTGEYVPLPLVDVQVRPAEGWEASGAVQNNTSKVLDEVTVALTLYDAAGEVVDIGGYEVQTTLQPELTQSFTIATGNNDPAIVDYLLQAQGNVASSEPEGAQAHGVAQQPALAVDPPVDARLLPRLP